MLTQSRGGESPQARGRELARIGRQLWQETGSVKEAAVELMNRYPDISSLQAHRYVCGLSQDQAAVRYNEVTGHQTSLGGTSINAWETWARARRGNASPPSFSSLLILATAYSSGPLGVANDHISPSDLVAEAYERLAPEDQLSLKKFTAADSPNEPSESGTGREGHPTKLDSQVISAEANVIGPDFNLAVPTVEYGNPEICLYSLPNPKPGQLLNLTWTSFGYGMERLVQQIKNVGRRVDVDACFGINEAGLVMATFLASAQFGRCPIGYLKCNKRRDLIALDRASVYPDLPGAPTIVLCDFEVKHADVVGFITREIRSRYPDAEIYFAVFGAMTKGRNLEVASFDDLTGAGIMRAADFKAVFIAATMSPPGIEPPLELR
ncbi:hypothetical protein [Streptosporangium carneum]|uniref:Uncharacterized protein n=1 Tax=Streptosporangium carneum TaxID=47481 RepID=A0A9W6I322_9ACTN|nr:hypothetical protein [Streptosporangium carneum]GLK11131.1 hypothetical protein GCM10017600_45370 [Streptosporangium carneum]